LDQTGHKKVVCPANWQPQGHQLSYVTQSKLFLDYAFFAIEFLVAKPEGKTAQMGG
jgi:hypothetical protein